MNVAPSIRYLRENYVLATTNYLYSNHAYKVALYIT